MNVATLIPIAAAAAGAVAATAGECIEGVSSAFAELLRDDETEAATAAATPVPPLGELPPISDLAASARQAITDFRQRFAKRLAEQGITLAQPVTLSVDAFGRVKSQPDHPQAAEIDAALAADDEMSSLFRQVSSHHELMRAGEEHQRFAEVYAKNPKLAVEQFSHLFDEKRETPQFGLQVFGETAEVVWR